MKHAKELTDKFYEAVVKDGTPAKEQVEQLVASVMEFTLNCAAQMAKQTHKLKHLETCRCKRCREVDKIVSAIQAWGKS